LNALERRLANWQPASAAGLIDRDRLLFNAGRAAAAAQAQSWGRLGWFTSACLALLAVTLGGLVARERGQGNRPVADSARVAAPSAAIVARETTSPIVGLNPDSCFVLTQRILAAGAGDLMPVVSVSNHPAGDPPRSSAPSLSPLRAWPDGLLDL
jgi:hypothetical protein